MSYENVTLMFSLPRSATQWWAWVFSHAIHSFHDPLSRHSRPEGLKKELDFLLAAAPGAQVFIADTSAIFFHERLRRTLPGMRCLYNFRNPVDVMESLQRQTGLRHASKIRQQNDKLFTHAFSAAAEQRLYYGVRSYEGVNRLWDAVTGGLMPPSNDLWEHWFDHIVDVPVAQQHRDDAKVKSLMGYAE